MTRALLAEALMPTGAGAAPLVPAEAQLVTTAYLRPNRSPTFPGMRCASSLVERKTVSACYGVAVPRNMQCIEAISLSMARILALSVAPMGRSSSCLAKMEKLPKGLDQSCVRSSRGALVSCPFLCTLLQPSLSAPCPLPFALVLGGFGGACAISG